MGRLVWEYDISGMILIYSGSTKHKKGVGGLVRLTKRQRLTETVEVRETGRAL